MREEVQAFEASGVGVVVDVFGEVGVNVRGCEAEARRPFLGDVIEAGGFETVVAGLLEDCGEVWGCGFAGGVFLQSLLADGPEGEDEGLAGVANPFFG